MAFPRSCFLAIALLAAVAPAQSADHPQTLPNLVAAGDVTADSAVLWARAEQRGPMLVVLATRPDFRGPLRSQLRLVRDPTLPSKFEFDGLQPGHEHHYLVVAGLRGISRGSFRTLARPGRHAGVRFGVSGDSRGELAPFVSVRNAVHRDLDFFVELGDTIYADYPSPKLPLPQASTLAEFRIKHEEIVAERLGLNVLAGLRSHTAWFGTIDDHEVTNDFAGGAHPSTDPRFAFTTESFVNETQLYANGLRAFVEYHPLRDERYGRTGDPRTEGKRRLYRQRRCGDDAAFFVLDARSFRDVGLPPVQNPLDPQQVGAFLVGSFDPRRTMLGATQIDELLDDLRRAQRSGVTWKFVMVPEPIQNLGVVAASDRFEGYAAERSRLLQTIDQEGIHNVVFIAADLHGTLVNNLTYQTAPFTPQIPTGAFEVITGAVAFDAPLGPTLVELGTQLGLISAAQRAYYDTLPRAGQDLFVQQLVDGFLVQLGYDPLGLAGSPVQATLVRGGYTAAHTFGWTEFDVDARTQVLTVTTWGIAPYREADLANPGNVIDRQPEIVAQFVVAPR